VGFLPEVLIKQCRNVIESYHASHGYFCLPDILWKSRLGPLIERDPTFRPLLRKASMARRAKKANECFVTIAATILSMEILASNFAGWSGLDPQATEKARTFLRQNRANSQTPLLDYYVYPSKYSNVFAKLSPPTTLFVP
jgi:hypothetical protein